MGFNNNEPLRERRWIFIKRFVFYVYDCKKFIWRFFLTFQSIVAEKDTFTREI